MVRRTDKPYSHKNWLGLGEVTTVKTRFHQREHLADVKQRRICGSMHIVIVTRTTEKNSFMIKRAENAETLSSSLWKAI